jgi:hypothetical protein
VRDIVAIPLASSQEGSRPADPVSAFHALGLVPVIPENQKEPGTILASRRVRLKRLREAAYVEDHVAERAQGRSVFLLAGRILGRGL